MSSLLTPPMEDYKSYQSRKPSKASKLVNRISKRSNSSYEHKPVVIDRRQKRVWKACEGCRMKKTRCDGESPCKRCKNDSLVCTTGRKKKTEFKHLPGGYVEVLENTHHALIATVQKLYAMVRNNESWDLGEPEMNNRGQTIIHDIASKLGCIRPSPDLPNNFPEGAEDFAELQAQLQAARAEASLEDTSRRKHSEESPYSPALNRTGQDDFLGPNHALDLTAHYMRAQQMQGLPRPSVSEANMPNAMQLAGGLNFFDETIRPTMLDCNTGFDISDHIDNIIYTSKYQHKRGAV